MSGSNSPESPKTMNSVIGTSGAPLVMMHRETVIPQTTGKVISKVPSLFINLVNLVLTKLICRQRVGV